MGSQGCHVDTLSEIKWEPCFVNHRTTRWQVTLLQQTKAYVSVRFHLHDYYFDSSLEFCELNRKDIWFSAGEKTGNRCVELHFASTPGLGTAHLFISKGFAVWWGGSPRQEHNYIWCDMCCNHWMCSLKWEGFIFSSWGQRSLPKLVLRERREGAFRWQSLPVEGTEVWIGP